MLWVCVGDVMDVFSVCIRKRGAVGAVYGECECFIMQMLYVCVLCASRSHQLILLIIYTLCET